MASNLEGMDLRSEVTFLLRHLNDSRVLAMRCRLIHLARVSQRLGYLGDTPENRALVLLQMVDDIIAENLAQSEGNVRRSAMWSAVKQLCVDDLDQAQVASNLGVSVSTVKRYVREATDLICKVFLPPGPPAQ